MKKAVLKQANNGGHTERQLVETLLNYGGRGDACSNWRNSLATGDMALRVFGGFLVSE